MYVLIDVNGNSLLLRDAYMPVAISAHKNSWLNIHRRIIKWRLALIFWNSYQFVPLYVYKMYVVKREE
jgi:hypothetical protein